jgi:hypothetical protein
MRLVLENIFWKLTSSEPWYHIPSNDLSWQTCYHHYQHWHRTGVWKAMISTLMEDLLTRGGFDLQKAFEAHEITLTRDCTGHFGFDYPSSLEGTWQLTTALLILVLLASDI